MNKRLLWCSLLAPLLYITSCSQTNIAATNETTLDPKTYWLQGDPCSPPCWENIYPGETEQKDVLNILKESPIIEPSSVHEETSHDITYATWKFIDDQSSWSGKIGYSDNYVDIISLTTPDLCLGDIIDAHGEPDYLNRIPYDVGGWVDLLWVDKGVLYSNRLAKPKAEITSNTCGGGLLLYEPGIALEEIPGIFFDNVQPGDLAKWTGYGGY